MIDVLPGGSGLLIGAIALVSVALYLWYLVALSQLFPRLGLPASQGWIPVLNEWKLVAQAGLPGWLVLLVLVPPLGVVFWVVRTVAMHRVGARTGGPVWLTVVGAVLPPLWATIMVSRFQEQYVPVTAQAPFTAAVLPGADAADEDAEFQRFLQGLQANGARVQAQVQAQVDPEPGLAPAPQLFDTEAHVLPPITAEALAAALGDPVNADGGVPPVVSVPPLLASMADPSTPVTPAHPVTPAPLSTTADPLGALVQAEYERLASEEFSAPQAAPFGDTVPQPRFSWDAAVQQPSPQVAPVVPADQPTFLAPQRNPLTQAIPVQRPNVQPQPERQPEQAEQSDPSEPTAAGHDTAKPEPFDLPPLHPASLFPGDVSAASANDATVGQRPAAALSTEDFLAAIGADRGGALIPAGQNDVTVTNLPTDHEDESDELGFVTTGATSGGSESEFSWVLEFDSGVVVQLQPDTIVGRAPSSEGTAVGVTVVDETRTLSKAHARFTFVGRLWLVEDLGSTNGVRLVQSDGSETVLSPYDPARATTHLWLGTLRATLREGRA